MEPDLDHEEFIKEIVDICRHGDVAGLSRRFENLSNDRDLPRRWLADHEKYVSKATEVESAYMYFQGDDFPGFTDLFYRRYHGMIIYYTEITAYVPKRENTPSISFYFFSIKHGAQRKMIHPIMNRSNKELYVDFRKSLSEQAKKAIQYEVPIGK
ncbi:MAG: hypothetical protein ACYS47_01565 [Planctomycetota bacterium]